MLQADGFAVVSQCHQCVPGQEVLQRQVGGPAAVVAIGGDETRVGTGASGGVINIITRKASETKPSLELSAGYGSFATQDYNLSLQAKRGPLSTFVSAGKSLSDGWRQNSDFDQKNFFSRFTYDAAAAGAAA